MNDRVVLAFSGGLASVAAVPWLLDTHALDVVALTIGFGQRRELNGIRERAIAAGALRCHVLDLEMAFAGEVIWPAVRAGVDCGLASLTVTAPLIARTLVEIARMEQAIAVAHGASGRFAVQIEQSIAAIDPSIRIVPTAVHQPGGRSALTAYVEAQGLVAPGDASPRVEQTLWARSVILDATDDAWSDAPEAAFSMTRPPRSCPDEAAALDVSFEQGYPVAVNGVTMPLIELMESVATIAGAHGVGRADLAELRRDGRMSRELRESPALTVLRQAHESLARLTTGQEEATFRPMVSAQYTQVMRDGCWFSPFRQALDAYVDIVERRVSGTVRLMLFKGESRVVGRRLQGYDQPLDATVAQAAR